MYVGLFVTLCVCICVLGKSLWKGLNLFLMYLISSHSNQCDPQEHSPELIREEGEVQMHGQRKQPKMGERGTENISKGPFKTTLVYSISLQNISFFRKYNDCVF